MTLALKFLQVPLKHETGVSSVGSKWQVCGQGTWMRALRERCPRTEGGMTHLGFLQVGEITAC